MPIFLILSLMLICSPVEWPAPLMGHSESATVLLTIGLMSAIVADGIRAAKRALRRLQFASPGEVMFDYHRHRGRQPAWLLGGFTVCLLVFGWGWQVFQWFAVEGEKLVRPGVELVLLAPLAIAWMATWWVGYPVERRFSALFGRAPISRREYILQRFRQQVALACIPVGLIIALQTGTRIWPRFAEQVGFQLVSIAMTIGVLLAAPWLLRIVLGLKPLPQGPLRERLEATARRMRFRYSDFLVWDTHGQAANAMIAGVLPRPRYVLFTDLLLHEMTPEQTEAVLGHEIGHARHNHLVFHFAFLALSVLAINGLFGLTIGASQPETPTAEIAWWQSWQEASFLLIFGGYIAGVFGFFSRRCEREADLFGAQTVSCGRPDCDGHEKPPTEESAICRTGIDTFINALNVVAAVNGISRTKPGWLASWQHGTIARRVEFLDIVRDEPFRAQRFRGRSRIHKWAAIGVLGVIVAALAATGNLSGWLK